MQRTPDPTETRTGVLLALAAVVCFSVAPVFIIAANSTFQALEIAFWRLAIGALFVGGLGLATRTSMKLESGQWRWFVVYGLVLAIHLSAYVAAVIFTSVAHAAALTYTSPVIIVAISAIFFKERPSPQSLVGLTVAVVGIGVLSGFQPNYGSCDLTTPGHCAIVGDGLALFGAALFAAIYSIIGRIESKRHPLFRYTFHVYGFGALWLLPAAIVLGVQHDYPLAAVGAVVALGVVPLGMGHTLFNAALRRANPALVNLIITQEITGGIALAAIFLKQIPTPLTLMGVTITLFGILIVMVSPPPKAATVMSIAQPIE